jgi:hypothetical protein
VGGLEQFGEIFGSVECRRESTEILELGHRASEGVSIGFRSGFRDGGVFRVGGRLLPLNTLRGMKVSAVGGRGVKFCTIGTMIPTRARENSRREGLC